MILQLFPTANASEDSIGNVLEHPLSHTTLSIDLSGERKRRNYSQSGFTCINDKLPAELYSS